jgi:hypothetical protein
VLRNGLTGANPFRYVFEEYHAADPRTQVAALLELMEPSEAVAMRHVLERGLDSDQPPAARRRILTVDSPPPPAAAATTPPPPLRNARVADATVRRVASAWPSIFSVPARPTAATPPPPPLPPLPAFEPRTVDPLEGDDLVAVRARLIKDGGCAICLSLAVAPHALSCSHSFCGCCIFNWLEKKQECPCCRAPCGVPVYERALDDILCAVVEPGLDVGAAAERQSGKLAWQAMQAKLASTTRGVLARAGAHLEGINAEFATLSRVTLERSMANLQEELHVLRQRIASGAGPAVAESLRHMFPRAAPPSWRIEYAQTDTSVCYTCFGGITQGSVRVVRSMPPPEWASLMRGARGGPLPVRDFYHLACRAPCCATEVVVGLSSLRPEDQLDVQARMAGMRASSTIVI